MAICSKFIPIAEIFYYVILNDQQMGQSWWEEQGKS